MKLFHLSDLHLGKRVNGFSMLDNQKDILQKIIALAGEHKPDAILVAGDVYDKSMPPVEAVQLLDWFLVQINEMDITLCLATGNHDSAERVAFGADLLKQSGIHIVQSYHGTITPITLRDSFGPLHIWMLPYLKPSLVRGYFPDETIDSYTAALSAVLRGVCPDSSLRNVMVAHQFVTGAGTSEGSEEISVGGSDNVDGSVFDDFDYAALGHIHRPQFVGRKTMRYCGTPLPYAFSEIRQTKSVTMVDMGEKGDINISELPLVPKRRMVEIRGSYNEVMNRSFYREAINGELDYAFIVLTDEQDEPDALMKLRNVYKNIIGFRYDNKRTQSNPTLAYTSNTAKRTPMELFGELFAIQNGQALSKQQEDYVRSLCADIWETTM